MKFFGKYVWVVTLKDKKGIIITNALQKISRESNCKPNKIWVVKDSEFYNRSIKSWLEKNAIEMYSIHNEGKSVIAERSIRTLKNKINKYMTSILKNVYIDKLDDLVIKYNNTYHATIKMKPADVEPSTLLTLVKKLMIKIQNLKMMIYKWWISKYKHIFAKSYVPNWFEEVFVIKKS